MRKRSKRTRRGRGSPGRLLLLVSVILPLSCAGGPEHFDSGDLLVMVYSTTNEPVIGAALREQQRLLGRSDSFGRLVLSDLPAGERLLLAGAVGYAPREVTFTYADPNQILYISLEPLGLRIATLLRAGDSAGMERLGELLHRARAPREEILLTEALTAMLDRREGWQGELAALEGALGPALTGELTRAAQEIYR